MTPLLLNLLALAAAPLLERALGGRPAPGAFVDGLVQVVVGGVLVVHVLPFGMAAAGWPALLALAGGALGGVLAHRVPGGERSAGALAVVALVLHAGIDGAALAAPDDHEGEGLLAWTVVLHTVPVGLATWRIARAARGVRFAAGLLLATALATGGGFLAAGSVLSGASPVALGVAQCAVAGALLHVLGHVGEGGARRPAGWGALAGAGIVALLAASHPIPRLHGEELGPSLALAALLAATAPPLVLGYLAAGLLHAAVPAERVARWGRAGLGAAVRGALLGVVVPVCACAAVPTWRRLLARGASPAAGLAFLVASPGVGVASVLTSLALLGPAFTGVRVGATVLVAVLAGAFAARAGRGAPVPPSGRAPPPAPTLGRALRFGLGETVEHTAPWVLAGLGVAALAEAQLAPDALAGLPEPLVVVAAALLGVPAYVCASGVAPLAAVLLHKGLPAGAAVAFLVTGPATNLVALAALRRLEGPRVARRFVGTLAGGAVLVGLLVDRLPPVALPDLHRLTDGAPSGLAGSAALALVVLFAAALVRSGAAGFLEPMLHPHPDEDAGGHDHGGHEHGRAYGGHGHDHGGHGHDHGGHGHDHAGHGEAQSGHGHGGHGHGGHGHGGHGHGHGGHGGHGHGGHGHGGHDHGGHGHDHGGRGDGHGGRGFGESP